MATDTRVFYRDIKPYDIPEKLTALAGPATGTVTLPVFLYWAPGRSTFDLGDRDDLILVYRVAITEGRVEDQRILMNSDTLHRLWPEIRLPERARSLWETQFPSLARTRR